MLPPDHQPLTMLRRAGRYRLPLRISEHVHKAELPFLSLSSLFLNDKKSEASTEFPEGRKRSEYMKSTCNFSADWQPRDVGLRVNAKHSLPLRISQAYSVRQNCVWSLTHPHTIRTDGPTQVPFQTCADYFCTGQCVQLVKYLVPLSLKQGSPAQNLQ